MISNVSSSCCTIAVCLHLVKQTPGAMLTGPVPENRGLASNGIHLISREMEKVEGASAWSGLTLGNGIPLRYH